ncbi:MAG: hypothetical protein ACRD2G_06145, partial [Terriglobia bacterium]
TEGISRVFALSGDAQTVIMVRILLQAGGSVPVYLPSLVARNLMTGAEVTLYAADDPAQFPNFLGMTNDGKQVLFNVWDKQAAGPAYIADTSTGASTPVPLNAQELATGGTISGSGNAVYLATSEGRIVKFALNAGAFAAEETVVPVTPYVSGASQDFSPGTLVQLQGALPGSKEELAGSILLDGSPIPILYAAPGDIRAQIPWEQRTGQASLTVNLPGDSPFHQNDLVYVQPISPRILSADPSAKTILGLALVKGDFSGMLTEQPGPGDIVIAYFTGLGAVSGGHPETGVPTPTAPLYPIMNDLTCQFLPKQSPAKTLFAGLAPLMTGIYQVAFQMPSDAGQAPITGLECRIEGPGESVDFIIGSLSGGGLNSVIVPASRR